MPQGTTNHEPADPEAPRRLSLTDFLETSTLQEIQDSFTAVAGLATRICDAEGNQLTAPTDPRERARSDAALDWLLVGDFDGPEGRFSAPIRVEGQNLGSIVVEEQESGSGTGPTSQQLRELAETLAVPEAERDRFVEAVERLWRPNRAAAVQFLHLLANSITRLCYREHQLRQRVEELDTLYRLSTLLAGFRNLQQVLDHAARSVVEAMGVKSASIRLLDETGRELVPGAVYNLSARYLEKGPIVVEQSPVYRQALEGDVVEVGDMRHDERVLYPAEAESEGLVSALFAGVIYKSRPIGVIQVGTGQPRAFRPEEKDMLRAIGQLLATAIENARLDASRREAEQTRRQLRLGADVQRRMLPQHTPELPPLGVAARYVPSLELSGDFYDFIPLAGNLGVAVGDVVGKGVAASLLMASVRSSLRAYAQDVYDIHEIIARVNVTLAWDTLENEFATLVYGVIDPHTLRLTYCNAGHEPPHVLRDGQIQSLETGGMILGIDESQAYQTGVVTLAPGDLVVFFTDGLVDTQNPDGELFGRGRLLEAIREAGELDAQEAVNHLLRRVSRFRGPKRPIDDTTLVAVRVDPAAQIAGATA